jgi:hypothetical protein
MGRLKRFYKLIVSLFRLLVQHLALPVFNEVMIQEAWLLGVALLAFEILFQDRWQLDAVSNITCQLVALNDHMNNVVPDSRDTTNL